MAWTGRGGELASAGGGNCLSLRWAGGLGLRLAGEAVLLLRLLLLCGREVVCGAKLAKAFL